MWLPLTCPQPRLVPYTRNRTRNSLILRLALNPLSHTSQAYLIIFWSDKNIYSLIPSSFCHILCLYVLNDTTFSFLTCPVHLPNLNIKVVYLETLCINMWYQKVIKCSKNNDLSKGHRSQWKGLPLAGSGTIEQENKW